MLVSKKQAIKIQEQSQEEIKKRINEFDEGLQERFRELADKEIKPLIAEIQELKKEVDKLKNLKN